MPLKSCKSLVKVHHPPHDWWWIKSVNIGPGTKYYLDSAASHNDYLMFYANNYDYLDLHSLKGKSLHCPDTNPNHFCHGYILQYLVALDGQRSHNMYPLHSVRNIRGVNNLDLFSLHHGTLKGQLSFFKDQFTACQKKKCQEIPFPIHLALIYTLLQERYLTEPLFVEEMFLKDIFIYYSEDSVHGTGLDYTGLNLYGWLLTILKHSNGKNPCHCLFPKIEIIYSMCKEGFIYESLLKGIALACQILMKNPLFLIAVQNFFKINPFTQLQHEHSCCTTFKPSYCSCIKTSMKTMRKTMPKM